MHYEYLKVELDVFPETEVDSIYNHKQIVFRYMKNNSDLIIPGKPYRIFAVINHNNVLNARQYSFI